MAFLGFVCYALATLVGGSSQDPIQEQQSSRLIRSMDLSETGMTSFGSIPCRCEVLQSSEGVANEWSASSPWSDSNDVSAVPSWRKFHGAATYTRNQEADRIKDDIEKMVIFGGAELATGTCLADTWLYYATTKSWIRPTLNRQPGRRQWHTMTTLCKSLVLLFGGHDDASTSFNDTWIFDGITETWGELKPLVASHSIQPRTHHSAVAMYQNLSSCRCKESVIVYGGASTDLMAAYHSRCYSDVWELRCVDDSMPDMVYQWVRLQGSATTSGSSPIPRIYQTVFPSRSKTSLYVWGGLDCSEPAKYPQFLQLHDLWQYDLASEAWSLIVGATYVNVSGQIYYGQGVAFAPTVTVEIDDKKVGVAVAGWQTKLVDLRSGEITVPFLQRLDAVHNFQSVGASAVMMGGNVVVFGGSQSFDTVLYPTVWNLSYSLGQWNWFANPCPINSPRGRILLQDNVRLAGNSIYIFGGFVTEDPSMVYLIGGRPVFNDVWELDLLTKQWWRTWSLFAPKSLQLAASAVVYDDLIIFFGGSTDAKIFGVVDPQGTHIPTALHTTWGYHTRVRRWTLYETVASPSPRVGASLTDVGNGSLLLFGGSSNGKPLNDMWLFTVCTSKMSSTCGNWEQLSSNRNVSGLDVIRYPGPRYYHSAVRVEDRMIVVGGSVAYKGCLHEMWFYSLSTGQWTYRSPLGLPRPPMLTCAYLMTSIGTKILVLYQNYTLPSVIATLLRGDIASSGVTYSYDVRSSSGWTAQAAGPQFVVSSVVPWRREIIALGPPDSHSDTNNGNRMILSSMTPGCAAGQSSTLWSNVSCTMCPIGSYARKGSLECTSCPGGLTTDVDASTSLQDCICPENQCQSHGSCYVIPYNSEIAPLCNCDTGYSGPQCQYPFLYIIVGSTIVSVVILVLICLLIFKCLQYRKGKLVVQTELERMKKVWSIGSEEIHVEGHVAGGGFGDVSKARYREMTVAVKKLHEDLISFIEEERAFAHEVELMQTIRHPNIVLFLGAGKYPDGCPFIVLEYVTNGTVRDILDRGDVPIRHARRIQFSLDAARGMMFLHSLTPPRMHRDLKSLNLLMTREWIVKVADFGTSRVVQDTISAGNLRHKLRVSFKGKQRIPKTDVRFELDNFPSHDLNAPLLSENVGTRQWQAPETIGHHTRYGLPADVYSFGIVMWEILTRKIPYDDRPDLFVHKLKADVMAGVRPKVPPDSPAAYVELMMDCWQTEPHRRPKFEDIVQCLNSMQEENMT